MLRNSPVTAFNAMILALFSLNAFADKTLPFKFVPDSAGLGGLVYLPCSGETFSSDCMLDTGSKANVIQNSGPSQQLASLGKTQRTGASGVSETCDLVDIQNFSVGGSDRGNFIADRCQSVVVDLIGMPALTGHSFSISFSHSTLELDVPIAQPLALPLRQVAMENQMILPLSFPAQGSQSISFEAVFDSGADFTILDTSMILANPENFQFIQNISGGTDATGQPVTISLYQMARLEIGGRLITDQLVSASDLSALRQALGPSVLMVLGNTTIPKFDWTFDLINGRWSAALRSAQ